MNFLLVLLFMVVSTFFGATGSLFLKKGSKDFKFNIPKLIKNWKLMLGTFFYVVSALIFVWVLKSTELSVLYPMNSLAYIWVAFLSIKYLNEKMSALKWIAVLLIILGVFFVTQ